MAATKANAKPGKSLPATKAGYKKMAEALAGCAVFSLAALEVRGSRGNDMTIDLKTKKIDRWQTQFFDALDLCGVYYDREAYYSQRGKKRKR